MSTRTPSQSNRRAEGRGEEEEAKQVIPVVVEEFLPLLVVKSLGLRPVPNIEDDKVLSWGLRVAMEETLW